MPGYWLTPVAGEDPAALGADRLRLSTDEGEALRRLAGSAHPRLLPSFKLALLIGEGPDGACGTGEAAAGRLRLEEPGEIALTGPLVVSHCGAAFLERLLLPAEALAIAASLPSVSHVRTLRRWWSEGRRAMLLKEE